MVVLTGSKARIDIAPSLENLSPSKRRDAFIKDGTLKQDGDAYVFQ